MGKGSSKMSDSASNNNQPKQDPFSVYIPLESLNETTIRSMITVVNDDQSWDLSQRTLLIFLLAINKKLKEIEDGKQFDEQTIKHAKRVRQLLVDRNNQPLNWQQLQQRYDKLANLKCTNLASYHRSNNAEPYFELTTNTRFDVVKRSREYMKKFREDGYKPEELKLYWNAEQLENLCPKEGESSEYNPPHDPSDVDCIENLRKYPVSKRNHSGTIDYINKGIEKAVFDIPPDAQIIVLNFANEQSPGGGYLRHAMAQEEVILYNSDGYRSLLDLKYKRMGGGYAIPEFGLAYVRNMRFFDANSEDEWRSTDMMVSACYCLNGHELYPNPRSHDEWKRKNLAKFRAFMAAAVANTIGDGSNTYLLLGPIGTGAFGNDVQEIGHVFREVLDMKMMNSTGPIRYAFEHIWFVSIDAWKNDVFHDIFVDLQPDPTKKAESKPKEDTEKGNTKQIESTTTQQKEVDVKTTTESDNNQEKKPDEERKTEVDSGPSHEGDNVEKGGSDDKQTNELDKNPKPEPHNKSEN